MARKVGAKMTDEERRRKSLRGNLNDAAKSVRGDYGGGDRLAVERRRAEKKALEDGEVYSSAAFDAIARHRLAAIESQLEGCRERVGASHDEMRRKVLVLEGIGPGFYEVLVMLDPGSEEARRLGELLGQFSAVVGGVASVVPVF